MKKSIKVTLFAVLAVTLVFGIALFSGCSSSSSDGGGGTTPTLQITVTPAVKSIPIGSTAQFTASAVMSDGTATTPAITWSSSATSVATINAAGLATAVADGTTTITATSGSVSGTAVLTVTPVTGLTYSGTFYSASANGGHIGVFPVTIDPSNTTSPITVDATNASKIQLKGAPGSSTAVIFHDVRFDDASNGGKNATKIYYAAIQSSGTSTTDIGYVDLTKANTAPTNNGVNSIIDIDVTAAGVIAVALHLMDPTSFIDSTTSGRVLYCASGMDSTHYYGYSMSFPAYIDAVPLTSIATAGSHVTVTTTGFTRTYIAQIDADAALGIGPDLFGYLGAHVQLGNPPMAFLHGGTNSDGSLLYASTNLAAGLAPSTNLAGTVNGYLINTSDLKTLGTVTDQGGSSYENGFGVPMPMTNMSSMAPGKVISKISVTVLASNVSPLLGTIAYRATWTPDGKYILQSGNDRVVILSTGTPTAPALGLYVDTATGVSTAVTGTFATAISSGLGKGTFGGIEVHDVISTPDSKYAIVNMRYFSDLANQAGGVKTSGVQLYDINNKAFIGAVTPTCGANAGSCHPALGDFNNRPTCGVLFKSN
jgi:hypothetical protein